jgi:DNA-directed RNA polymerase specialized sigma subunit
MNREQEILELYFCGDDRRMKTIASIIGMTEMTVSRVIDRYFKGLIYFQIPETLIFHSKLNEI